MAIRELNNEEIKFVSGGFHWPNGREMTKAFNYTTKKVAATYYIDIGLKNFLSVLTRMYPTHCPFMVTPGMM